MFVVALAHGVVHLAEVVDEPQVVAIEREGCGRRPSRVGWTGAEDAAPSADLVAP